MTTLTNLSASDLRRAAEIKDQIEVLQAQLNTCLGGGYGFDPNRSQRTTRRDKRAKRGETVADCVLEAMNNGSDMSIQDIITAASKIRGKPISRALMSFTLAQLKKAKRIANPARGQYRKRWLVATPLAAMKPSLERPCFSRRTRVVSLYIAICLPLYVFGTGPVAWATNDAFHPRYLPDEVNLIYMPLAPLEKIDCINCFFNWWTAIVWRGFPAGYTTLWERRFERLNFLSTEDVSDDWNPACRGFVLLSFGVAARVLQ
jgi:hypothetical protein